VTVTPQEVAPELTPATVAEVKGALAAAFKAIVGSPAPDIALSVLAAQSALETASWQKMRNWNLGFITHGSDNFDWFVLGGSNLLHFRAYASLDQGAADYVTYLNKRGLLDFAASGDLQGYVNRLKEIRYAGASCDEAPQPCGDYNAYLSGMRGFVTQFQGVSPKPSEAVPADGVRIGPILAAVALAGGAYWLATRKAA
jgi:hypothetical protein